MIKIIDLEIGNIASVENWLRRNDKEFCTVRSDNGWEDGDAIVLPGVGNSVSFVEKIRKWQSLLRKLQLGEYEKLIAICGGFQALCETVTEGGRTIDGLGIVSAHSSPLPAGQVHTGWEEASSIYLGIRHDPKIRRAVYYNHGCAVYPLRNGNFTFDNSQSFSIGLFSEQFKLMQFHPEKSGGFGDLIAHELFHD